MGDEIRIEISTSFKKSLDNKPTIPLTLAPSTLRIPISLKRCLIVKAAKPNKPRQATNTDKNVKALKTARIFCSDLYMLLKSSSKKAYLKGFSVPEFFHAVSISFIVVVRLSVFKRSVTVLYQAGKICINKGSILLCKDA